MIWTREQAKALTDRALSFSKAEETQVVLTGGDRANVRFARNSVTTSGASSGYSLAIIAKFGQKVGTVTASEFSDASLQRAARNAEEIARLSPDNPEAMPALGPQTYPAVKAFFDDAASATPDWRAGAVRVALDISKEKDVVSAGFVETSAQIQAVATSKGQFAYDRVTAADYNLTARTQDGTGSGWASKSFNQLGLLDPRSLAAAAIDKAARSHNPTAIEPGKYTVVLEPAASVELIQNLLNVDARNADEGRSFLSKSGGGTRLGEKLMDERVTIYSDPSNADAPAGPWVGDGRPTQRTVWIDKGAYQNLSYSRYWAEKQGKPALAGPSNFIMDGGTQSLEDLIRSTTRGLLVTRTWYIRGLDPQTLLFTGLTRDGTFYIEDGQIRYAVKNMRFNESPIIMLNNLDALGRPTRVRTDETGQPSLVPPMRIRDFNFSSLSDAV
jgi:predicted Zn-dependent protease